MADIKKINTRIQLKYDLLENWVQNDPVLLEGEVAVATITTAVTSNGEAAPVMFKVGVGGKTFTQLDWSAALAADVYAWAKKSVPAVSDFGDIITAARQGLISADSVVKTLNTLKGDVTLEGDSHITVTKGTNKLTFALKLSDAESAALSSGINATKVAAYDKKYDKPVNGIPKADLASAVQTSLGKADTALQTHQTIATGSGNGTIAVAGKDVAVKGLLSAAYTESTAYATAAQGTKADNAMPKTGGTFTGPITLSGVPTDNMHAATKLYVDNKVNAVKQFKYTVASNAATTPVGVVWYSGTTEATKVTGTLAASATTEYNIYLVPCKHTAAGTQKGYDEYLTVKNGTAYSWEVIGNTQDVDLSAYAKSADVVPNTRKIAGKALSADISAADLRTALNVADGANKYTHPVGNAASKSSGLYKFSTDATSHISGVTAVAKSDITALGIPAQDTTYSAGTHVTIGTDHKISAAWPTASDSGYAGINKTGTVTSVGITTTANGGLKVTGGAVTGSGTIKVDIDDTITFIFNCGSSSTILDVPSAT